MATYEVRGNDYEESFEIVRAGPSHAFDSFESAMHARAPTCAHCECPIIGHGLEASGRFFCSADCAKCHGGQGLVCKG